MFFLDTKSQQTDSEVTWHFHGNPNRTPEDQTHLKGSKGCIPARLGASLLSVAGINRSASAGEDECRLFLTSPQVPAETEATAEGLSGSAARLAATPQGGGEEGEVIEGKTDPTSSLRNQEGGKKQQQQQLNRSSDIRCSLLFQRWSTI